MGGREGGVEGGREKVIRKRGREGGRKEHERPETAELRKEIYYFR